MTRKKFQAESEISKLCVWEAQNGTDKWWMWHPEGKGRDLQEPLEGFEWVRKKGPIFLRKVFSGHSDIVVVEGLFRSLRELFFWVESINFVFFLWLLPIWEEKFWSPRYLKLFPTFQLSNCKLWFRFEAVHGKSLEQIVQNPLQVPESYHKTTPQKILYTVVFYIRLHLAWKFIAIKNT